MDWILKITAGVVLVIDKVIMSQQKNVLKGQSDFNEYYEECLYKLTDLDYFCIRN